MEPRQRAAMSIDDFAVWAGIGRTKAWEEVREKRLRTFKVGRRRLATLAAAETWLNEREGAS